MSVARAVGRNTIIQFGGKAIGTVLGLITVGLLQHYLGATGYGAYTTAMAYLGFLSVMADLGLYMMLIKELAKPNTDQERIVGNLLGLRWVSAALILGAGTAIVAFFPYSADVRQAVFIGAFSFVAIAATQLLTGIFQTRLQMGRIVGAELTGRVVLLVATTIVIGAQAGLKGAIVAVVSGSLVNLLIVWISARRFFPLRPRFEWDYWKTILRETWPVAISVVLNLIYFRIDTIFLSLFSSQYQVGLYGAAYRVLEILNTFPIMFVGLIIPVLGRAFETNDHERFTKIFQRGFELLCMAALPIITVGGILATSILVKIGGQEFAPATTALQLLLIAVGALFLNSLSGGTVTVIHKQRQMVWTYLSVAVVGTIAYLVLIPQLGIRGAAIGTILTESSTAIVGYVFVLRSMKFSLRLGVLPKIFLATIVGALVTYALSKVDFWLALVIGPVSYVALLFLFKALEPTIIKELLSSDQSESEALPSA